MRSLQSLRAALKNFAGCEKSTGCVCTTRFATHVSFSQRLGDAAGVTDAGTTRPSTVNDSRLRRRHAMRGLLLVTVVVLTSASPAVANWGYSGASAGYANAGSSYGYGGYGYGNLSDHGAGLPSWGDCPCCAGAWDGYCEEKAARAAKRHCNGGHCGPKYFGRKRGCDSCGANGDCGCAQGAGIEYAPADAQPIPPAPEAAPAAAAAWRTR
jgi:hypothetical protein